MSLITIWPFYKKNTLLAVHLAKIQSFEQKSEKFDFSRDRFCLYPTPFPKLDWKLSIDTYRRRKTEEKWRGCTFIQNEWAFKKKRRIFARRTFLHSWFVSLGHLGNIKLMKFLFHSHVCFGVTMFLLQFFLVIFNCTKVWSVVSFFRKKILHKEDEKPTINLHNILAAVLLQHPH